MRRREFIAGAAATAAYTPAQAAFPGPRRALLSTRKVAAYSSQVVQFFDRLAVIPSPARQTLYENLPRWA